MTIADPHKIPTVAQNPVASLAKEFTHWKIHPD